MSLNFYTLDTDTVIEGYVVMASTTYEFALNHFVPLIGRLDIQRDALNTKFYSRLEDDIVRGCVMPPITIAMIHSFPDRQQALDVVQDYISENIESAFVLDGIQRLNTLHRASFRDGFDANRAIHVNFIIASSRDRLLYRMITLNNGQKPMSARHQIDILADAFFDFDAIDLKLVAEKGKGRVRAPESFKKADFVKGYIAYLSGSVNIDNQKIIEEKMDELIALKIIDSDIPTSNVEFMDIVDLVNKFSKSSLLRDWIRVQNNFIGFCVGAKTSAVELKLLSIEKIEESVKNFEKAFSSINVSKVNLGKVRREMVAFFFQNYLNLSKLDEFELLDRISYRL
ncbi:hypothetical protein [Acidithiobacillus ferriphilus]|jgi:hypothetical protein|uniref:hypothetical protein n=1 Tax=Acidithiobacillus ferriphilus TaxID=1689834 RepID=UPI001C070B62|nr:hypothetical protein [Acidithiobacillus ferriphilus]MBU2829300.1 hypothetical protein [Acidithiobacillus ferriphilus]